MRRYWCGICVAEIAFDADRCGRCGTGLGYVPRRRDVRPLHPTGPAQYGVDGGSETFVRCLNHAWGCNWILTGASGDTWCASCRLTRGRPDTANPDAVDAWSTAESAKRQLVDQLIALRLPFDSPTGDRPLLFDLLYLPDGAGATGHLDGVVTLDLRETDDTYRDDQRRRLAEPYRTVIGHFRHEVGHHYWRMLVPGWALDDFRALFGDERCDYATAIAANYESSLPRSLDRFVSRYAAAHPSEDWAETFAHYLHIRDGIETAEQYGFTAADTDDDAAGLLDRWRQLADGINALNRGLGHAPAYPFRFGRAVEDKLAFVHDRVRDLGGGSRPASS